MVIFGGLELVAAGYIIHKHSQNKKERQRLQEEAEILEEEEYRRRSRSEVGRRRRRSHDREHSSQNRRHRHDHEDKYEGRRPSAEAQAQYLKPEYPQYQRASSAPPAEYPPTGWPLHWKQSQYPEPNNTANYDLKNTNQYQRHQASSSDLIRKHKYDSTEVDHARGRSESKLSPESRSRQGDNRRHARLGAPDDEPNRADYYNAPPAYSE